MPGPGMVCVLPVFARTLPFQATRQKRPPLAGRCLACKQLLRNDFCHWLTPPRQLAARSTHQRNGARGHSQTPAPRQGFVLALCREQARLHPSALFAAEARTPLRERARPQPHLAPPKFAFQPCTYTRVRQALPTFDYHDKQNNTRLKSLLSHSLILFTTCTPSG
jgi:hypothetical protein